MDHLNVGRVFILDFAPEIRLVISEGLFAAGYLTLAGMADEDYSRAIEAFGPDVLIPRIDRGGLGPLVPLIRRLRGVPVLALASKDVAPSLRVEAHRVGVDTVFVEPWDTAELVARVDVLMENRRPRRLFSVGDLTIDHDGRIATRNGVELELTLTEYNLLLDLVTNVGHVLSKRQLLERVWGFDDFNVNLVEVHISTLRRKLENLGPRLIDTVRGVGYVIRPAHRMQMIEASDCRDRSL